MSSASVGFHCPECVSSHGQRVYSARDLAPKPTLVVALIGACVAAYFAQVASGEGDWQAGSVFTEGVLFGPLVETGEYWRIITSGFLHAGLIHLAFNMYALYIFGPALQRELGLSRAALVYTGGLLGGAAAVLLFNWDSPTLGASGAVLGLAGGLSVALWARGINITQTSLGGIFLINLALPLVSNISFWGHLGGILGGALIAYVLITVQRVMQRSRQEAVGAAVAVLIGLAVLGVVGANLALDPFL